MEDSRPPTSCQSYNRKRNALLETHSEGHQETRTAIAMVSITQTPSTTYPKPPAYHKKVNSKVAQHATVPKMLIISRNISKYPKRDPDHLLHHQYEQQQNSGAYIYCSLDN